MKVQIIVDEDWSDCETCGSFSWEHVHVLVDGVEILDHRGDDHLGGGLWSDWRDALRDTLTAMGHDVEITEVERY